ncbi:SDR family NAD(P)-dependent oxidoreductase [Nocardia mexicana]|uniref:Short-subunit dehydrogenase n=1 Tax=Nocardia mexicana TaxID=279262 RepID=A0A370GWT3_9NOCA|nr:SDR family NAD(P)-dependent oxidoreductase [Nocardia mexicana]RDI47044.1 short-subunit dehydrogenase [Nocardia mexicana]
MTKTALVTGAASGMGRIVAHRLAAAGYRVAAVDVNETGLAETARRSPNMTTYTCDVSDSEAVAAVVEKVRAELGPIEHLVHAAALCRVGSTLAQNPSEMRRMMDINYLGTVHLCQAVIPAMRTAGSGTVVLFASVAGWLPSPGLAGYSASKFAVVCYAEALSLELSGSGVRLIAICPPHVETPFLDGVRSVDPAILAGSSGMAPEKVVDAMEKAVANPKSPLFVFPGPARPLWLARRFVPGLLRKQIARMVKPTVTTDTRGE